MKYLLSLLISLSLISIAFAETAPKSWRQIADEAVMDSNYAKAAEFYAKWSEADPTDAVSLYNYACCEARLNRPDAAIEALRKAAAAGWTDALHAIEDPDLQSLRERDDFKSLVKDISHNARTRYGGYPMYTCLQERTGQYLVVLPETYDPAQRYPLVILLHNYGANPEDFAEVTSLINTRDFIYAVPEASYPVLDGGSRSFSFLRERSDFSEDPSSAPAAADWIVRVADDIIKRYPIASEKFWIVGFSQGGALAHITAALHPDRVAGYVAMGGYLIKDAIAPGQFAAEQTAGVHALILHGQQDAIVGLEESIYAFNTLKQAGVDVSIEALDIPHRFTAEVALKANAWLISKLNVKE